MDYGGVWSSPMVERPEKFFNRGPNRCQKPCMYDRICHVDTAANKGKFNNEWPVSLFLETGRSVLCSDFIVPGVHE